MGRFLTRPSFTFVLIVGLLGIGANLTFTSIAAAQDADPAAVTPDNEVSSDEVLAAASPAEAAATVSDADSLNYTINSLVMMGCAVLVLLMQAGFAMLEVGLNEAKNTVNILAKNLLDLAIGAILFLLVGYGLMYPGGDYAGGYFGYAGPWMERDSASPNLGAGFSNSADFLFQVAFAATAATIVSGAVAGRMKFVAYLVYSAFLTGLIYPISGMWKWGGGFLAEAGFQDFAGSILVHSLGGFAALAGAIVLGPRLGRFTKDGRSIPMPGHNITFAALGVFILFVGWFGFNSGSQLTYAGWENTEATTYIAVTTILAAAAGCLSALITSWIISSKPDLTMALNGVLAGLVGITANCDRVSQGSALVIGLVAGFLVVMGVILLDKLRIDDPVGAWPVHGLCGIWGGIATGIFGAIPTDDAGVELFTRNGFLWVQVYSTAIIVAWAFFTMLILFFVLKVTGLLRVTAAEERAGLDFAEHRMHAYPADPAV